MRRRSGIVASGLLAFALIRASANVMDQIEPYTSLFGELEYGIAQIFPDQPLFSSMIIDDFEAVGPITSVSMAFELSDPAFFSRLPSAVRGWRISVFESVAAAERTSADFTDNALATVVVTQATYTTIGTVGNTTGFRVDFGDLTLDAGVGLRWIGVAAILPAETQEQVFLLGNAQPVSYGGGAPNNAVFVNPGEQFGAWRSYALNLNAAYRVESVPEPAALTALALAVGMLTRRHNNTRTHTKNEGGKQR